MTVDYDWPYECSSWLRTDDTLSCSSLSLRRSSRGNKCFCKKHIENLSEMWPNRHVSAEKSVTVHKERKERHSKLSIPPILCMAG